MSRTIRWPIVLGLALIALLVLAGCAPAATPVAKAPTPTPTTAPTSAPTKAPTAAPTSAPTTAPTATSPAATVPDFTKLGFPTVAASQDITPGQAATITAGPFTIQVPADAFDVPVKFEVLTGDLATFLAKVPTGQMPVLDFAFRVTNSQTHQLIGAFKKPVTLTAKTSDITDKSMYYNIATDGAYAANPTGMQVKAGELTHPVAGAVVGWVITAPELAATGGKIALLLPESKTTRYEAHDRPDFENEFKRLCPLVKAGKLTIAKEYDTPDWWLAC